MKRRSFLAFAAIIIPVMDVLSPGKAHSLNVPAPVEVAYESPFNVWYSEVITTGNYAENEETRAANERTALEIRRKVSAKVQKIV